MFNYGPSHFDSRGEENKAQIYQSSQTAACLESSDPSNARSSSFQILRRRSEQQKSILTWFLSLFYVFTWSNGYQTVHQQAELGLGCLSRSCFHGNHWTSWTQALRETLSNAVYSPSFSEVMLNSFSSALIGPQIGGGGMCVWGCVFVCLNPRNPHTSKNRQWQMSEETYLRNEGSYNIKVYLCWYTATFLKAVVCFLYVCVSVCLCVWSLKSAPASKVYMWQVFSLKCCWRVKRTNYLSRRLWTDCVVRISDSPPIMMPCCTLLPLYRVSCSIAVALHRWSSQADTSSTGIQVSHLDAWCTQGYSSTGSCWETVIELI